MGVDLFSQFSLATESSDESSSQYTYNPKRAHYEIPLAQRRSSLKFPPTNVCSWLCCSLFLMQSVSCCRYHKVSLWPTQPCEITCEHRCFPFKPGNLNATWNQLLTCVVPAKCSELKNQKSSGAVCLTIPISFLLLYYTEIHHAWASKTYRHFIHKGGWPLWDEEKSKSSFPYTCGVFSDASHRLSRETSTAQLFTIF